MDIAYICTNYNNSAFTVTAVNSLLSAKGHNVRIFVVDNASRPEEIDILRKSIAGHPAVHLIANPDNVGYFRGLNVGIREARRLYPGIEWLVVGNNDLEFPPDFCDRVSLNHSTFVQHSVISPDVVTLDGEHQNPHVIEKISAIREIFYDLYYSNYHLGKLIYKLAKIFPRATRRGDEDEWQTARPIYQGHGSCYLLTPRFFRNFEALWAPTFMMAEELFLSQQLAEVGERVYYSPAIKVIHHWHGALQNVPSRQRWRIAREAHREYRKHVRVLMGKAETRWASKQSG
jgi:GT2 family glycosyltransferase